MTTHARARRAFFVLAAGHVAIFLFLAAQSDRTRSDFVRYWQIASAPGRPYVDFPVEYPPLVFAVFKTVAALGRSAPLFSLGLFLLNLIAEAVLVAVLFVEWGVQAAAFYLAVVLPLLPILYYRIDFWPTAAAAVALALRARNRRVASACAFVVGFGLKLWPFVLCASLLDDENAGRRRAALGAVLCGCAAVLLIWLALGGSTGLRQVMTFRGAHGWSIESVAGSVIHLAGHDAPRMESGAWRIGEIPPGVSAVLLGIAFPFGMAGAYAGFRARRPGAAWLVGVGALILGSTLISPQFFVWLAPGAAMAWVDGDRISAFAVAAAILLSTVVLAVYDPLLDGAFFAEWLVIIRNLACGVAVAASARALLAARRR